jgi:hypothetical protein
MSNEGERQGELSGGGSLGTELLGMTLIRRSSRSSNEGDRRREPSSPGRGSLVIESSGMTLIRRSSRSSNKGDRRRGPSSRGGSLGIESVRDDVD